MYGPGSHTQTPTPGYVILKPKPVMLMHGALPRMPLEPGIDTPPVEPTQALQPRHFDADLKLLQANGTLGRVDAVLLRGLIREHARPSLQRHRGRRPAVGGRDAAAAAGRRPAMRRGAAAAVRQDTVRDVLLAPALEVGQRPGRELAVADGTLVLLRDLAPGLLGGPWHGGEGAVGVVGGAAAAAAADAGDGGARGYDGGGLGGCCRAAVGAG